MNSLLFVGEIQKIRIMEFVFSLTFKTLYFSGKSQSQSNFGIPIGHQTGYNKNNICNRVNKLA